MEKRQDCARAALGRLDAGLKLLPAAAVAALAKGLLTAAAYTYVAEHPRQLPTGASPRSWR
jgi:F0F1-type ATP synthase membrane subunit c/vacuolar-type H+-ATPase subunit K